MIHIVIGTKAQLIKMAPVMKALNDRGILYRYISTGQHRETTAEILENFRLRGPDVVLYDGPDITSIPAMIAWATRILWQAVRDPEVVFGPDRSGLVLVHGDTFSTLLGALLGRVARLKVGHVESGLRSFNLFHPFPEELTRILVFRLSTVYFCPGPWAMENIVGHDGLKIDTGTNTLRDALEMAVSAVDNALPTALPPRYAIVTIHRFENIYTASRLKRVVAIVRRIAARIPVIFILHKPTERKLRSYKLYEQLATAPNIELHQRYDYFRFIRLLSSADFVVSDGGSNQEECHYLGKPVLLLRKATERREGLGSNCTLSCYDPVVIDNFLEHYPELAHENVVTGPSPSGIIAQACIPYGGYRTP